MKVLAGSKNRVLVQPSPKQSEVGGFIIPDEHQKVPLEGIVMSVSRMDEDGRFPELTIGDKVYYPSFAGREVEVKGTDLIVLFENEILLYENDKV